jgi:hypothetical protein
MTTYTQKITFGEMRESGVRDVLICCRDHRCGHHVTVNADRWPDYMRLSDMSQPQRGVPGLSSHSSCRGSDSATSIDVFDDRRS